MGNRFSEITFTETVKNAQEAAGSRASYAKMESRPESNHVLGPAEADFIVQRDSFYMATVSETGWPYVQHRGGPTGFVQVLSETSLGFADFRGNRQYISVGNLQKDNRVSLFFMDYPNRTRLKLLGRSRIVEPGDDEIFAKLELPDYRARIERGVIIDLEAFDWNCPQHITPRFSASELEEVVGPLNRRIAELEAALRGSADG